MSALLRDGNTWQHPDFDVCADDDGYIAIDSDGLCLLLKPIDARDLMQALAQAIAAAELVSVQEVSQLCTHGASWDDCPDCRH